MTTHELTPDQRERIREVLHAELERIRAQALAAGADPAEIAAVIEQRRRALDGS